MDEQQKSAEQQVSEQEKLYVAAKAHAVGEAMREIMIEQQAEVIRRAQMKLVQMGFRVEDEP